MRNGTLTLRQTGGYLIGVTQDLAAGPVRPFVVAPHGRAGAYVRVTGPERDERYGRTPLDGSATRRYARI
ncbi:hypothetical protein [Streptomyces longwoodensis]|uniref:hypothetical protein n=1 Tax=Streptomyces longwoodensis TaxID=68231 RepID=UPI00131CD511|nr:hypothetical protein [Streptomyces longwoodensis]